MNAYANRIQETKSKIVADSSPKLYNHSEVTSEFKDNRPIAASQRRIKEMVGKSGRNHSKVNSKSFSETLLPSVAQLFKDEELTYDLYNSATNKAKIELLCKRFDCMSLFKGDNKPLLRSRNLWKEDWKKFFKQLNISQEDVTSDNFSQILDNKIIESEGLEDKMEKIAKEKQALRDQKSMEREALINQDSTFDRRLIPEAKKKQGATRVDMGWFGIGVQASEEEPMETYGVAPCVALGIKETESNIIVLAHFHSTVDVPAAVALIIREIKQRKRLDQLTLDVYIAGGKRQYTIGASPKGQLDGPELFNAILQQFSSFDKSVSISYLAKWNNAQGQDMDLQMTSGGLKLITK